LRVAVHSTDGSETLASTQSRPETLCQPGWPVRRGPEKPTSELRRITIDWCSGDAVALGRWLWRTSSRCLSRRVNSFVRLSHPANRDWRRDGRASRRRQWRRSISFGCPTATIRRVGSEATVAGIRRSTARAGDEELSRSFRCQPLSIRYSAGAVRELVAQEPAGRSRRPTYRAPACGFERSPGRSRSAFERSESQPFGGSTGALRGVGSERAVRRPGWPHRASLSTRVGFRQSRRP